MFTSTLSRPFSFLAEIISRRHATKAHPRGSMPSWINDPKLSKQLLNDTGLTAEDFDGRQSNNAFELSASQQPLW
ncbi:hypothetical protein [Marivita geojedonensis]|uniref:hypothetical protein n=1 Tax=Marivita geojedonensis TaxID=1123756 RepID=UPI000D4911BB|nr:hypothetical protein [Marivita geojedonensis]PRY72180.1 hypothetical protein CLV76_13619 [Marivita geojedonensis]